MDYYGQIDFTALCRLWKQHRELFKMVDFKGGPHALLKVNFNERQQLDEYGNTHYLRASCKKDEQKDGVNYYISNSFKPSQNQQPANTAATQQVVEQNNEDDLPF